jgi:hypothetical protein
LTRKEKGEFGGHFEIDCSASPEAFHNERGRKLPLIETAIQSEAEMFKRLARTSFIEIISFRSPTGHSMNPHLV